MFALDISENYMRVLELRKIADKVFLQGLAGKAFFSKKEFPALLKSLVGQSKPEPILSSDVALAIPEEESFVKIVTVPKQDRESLLKFLNEEIVRIVPYEEKEVYWDWKVLETGQNTDSQEVMLTASPKSIIDGYIHLIMEAGFTPTLIESESNALLWGVQNPLGQEPPLHEPVLIVNVGDKKTTLIIFAQGAIRFSISLNIDMSTKPDEKTTNYLSPTSNKGKEFLNPERKLAEKSLTVLTKKLREYIDYYQEHLLTSGDKNSPSINNIIVSGAWATLPELSDGIAKKIGLPVNKPSYPISIDPAYTTALGLALRGLYEEAQVR